VDDLVATDVDSASENDFDEIEDAAVTDQTDSKKEEGKFDQARYTLFLLNQATSLTLFYLR
jgi:hypothetical protein